MQLETPLEAPDGPGEALRQLEQRIRLVRPSASNEGRASAVVATGWHATDRALGSAQPAVAGQDATLGGLARGCIHEWIGVGDPKAPRLDLGDAHWSPPLCVLIHLAWCALETAARGTSAPGSVLWIGSRMWPYARALAGDFRVRASGASLATPQRSAARSTRSRASVAGQLREHLELARSLAAERRNPDALLARSIFVDAKGAAARLWAVDGALRCPSVLAVVADGSGFDMAATRRLQLAAELGEGLGLLARPPREEKELSAAATRWRVRRAVPREGFARPRWSLDLLRHKNAFGFGARA